MPRLTALSIARACQAQWPRRLVVLADAETSREHSKPWIGAQRVDFVVRAERRQCRQCPPMVVEPHERGVLLAEERVQRRDPISVIIGVRTLLHLVHEREGARAFAAAPVHFAEERQNPDVVRRELLRARDRGLRFGAPALLRELDCLPPPRPRFARIELEHWPPLEDGLLEKVALAGQEPLRITLHGEH